ncbi:MAG: YerC/YecD family TrpR-related protein [Patescibacteria group bacterium]
MNWDNTKTDELMGAIVQLRSKAEAKRFFRDLLTEDELIEFGNRWLAARLLARGVSYTKIVDRTRLSSRTIARVSKWLNAGADGYKLMIGRLNHHHNSSPAG